MVFLLQVMSSFCIFVSVFGFVEIIFLYVATFVFKRFILNAINFGIFLTVLGIHLISNHQWDHLSLLNFC